MLVNESILRWLVTNAGATLQSLTMPNIPLLRSQIVPLRLPQLTHLSLTDPEDLTSAKLRAFGASPLQSFDVIAEVQTPALLERLREFLVLHQSTLNCVHARFWCRKEEEKGHLLLDIEKLCLDNKVAFTVLYS